MNDPALVRLFARPSGVAEAWRERPFECVLDGKWITGVFDRVVIERESAGKRPTRVVLVDFKSDRLEVSEKIGEAAKRHAGQLDLYRRIVALLTGVSVARIDCQLVFTGSRQAITMPPST